MDVTVLINTRDTCTCCAKLAFWYASVRVHDEVLNLTQSAHTTANVTIFGEVVTMRVHGPLAEVSLPLAGV